MKPILPALTLLIITILSMAQPTKEKEKFTDLRGSKAKVESAYNYAIAHDYSFVRDEAHLERFLKQKLLVKLKEDANYTLSRVSFPYIRPAGELFIRRLSVQYRKATGSKLRVTSAVRTQGNRLWNSSAKSVHPAGIAIDFGIPFDAKSREWLEKTLLTLQERGVILATRERNPPHYHVVVLCKEYEAYVAQRTKKEVR